LELISNKFKNNEIDRISVNFVAKIKGYSKNELLSLHKHIKAYETQEDGSAIALKNKLCEIVEKHLKTL
jgi:hypothetical protein